MIDTSRVKDRRPLRFETLASLRGEIESLAMADRAGKLQSLGNWTLGQTFGHLATWIDCSYDGFPIKAPWWLRLLVRPMKRQFLHGSMRAGIKIPRVDGGTIGIEPCSLDDGLLRYQRAIDRLERDPPTQPSILFGPMSHDEWISLNLRHAELHLGYFKPVP